jgi:endo-1,4-beta-xylanase
MKQLLILAALVAPVFAADPPEVALWPNGAPGSEGKIAKEIVNDRGKDGVKNRAVSSIHNPTLTVYLPAKEKANGAAVVICPGGGHRYLAIDHEGYDVAKWLSSAGVAAFVLKYRLAREEGSSYKVDTHALGDGLRAIRTVRARAKEWSVDPTRVGIIGFSAGGEVAALAGTRFDAGQDSSTDAVERQSSRPDFMLLIYPGVRPESLTIPKDASPAFIAQAADDTAATPERTTAIYLALRKAGIPAELHIYGRGGHGFGMRDRPMPVSSWPARAEAWMADLGFLKKL